MCVEGEGECMESCGVAGSFSVLLFFAFQTEGLFKSPFPVPYPGKEEGREKRKGERLLLFPYGYEWLRPTGFSAAVVESHLTFGLGYKLTDSVSLNLEYMHALENTISESSMGDFITLETSLEEDAVGFSLAWEFE
jgi:hypothetical protein